MSTVQRNRTFSTSSKASETRSSSGLEEETVDELLAEYHYKQSQMRRESNAREKEKARTYAASQQTVPHESMHTAARRVGRVFGSLIDGKGWRRT